MSAGWRAAFRPEKAFGRIGMAAGDGPGGDAKKADAKPAEPDKRWPSTDRRCSVCGKLATYAFPSHDNPARASGFAWNVWSSSCRNVAEVAPVLDHGSDGHGQESGRPEPVIARCEADAAIQGPPSPPGLLRFARNDGRA